MQVSGGVLPDDDAAQAACKELVRRLGRQHPVQATFRQLEGKCSALSGCRGANLAFAAMWHRQQRRSLVSDIAGGPAMGMTTPCLALAPASGSSTPCGYRGGALQMTGPGSSCKRDSPCFVVHAEHPAPADIPRHRLALPCLALHARVETGSSTVREIRLEQMVGSTALKLLMQSVSPVDAFHCMLAG